jgi:cell division protein FtsI/penicillin-binding protein 2
VRLIERRVGLLFAVFAIAFCGVTLRAAWLQAVKGGELSASARSQQTGAVEVPGIRGTILDRTGKELAVSENAATVFVTPYRSRTRSGRRQSSPSTSASTRRSCSSR